MTNARRLVVSVLGAVLVAVPLIRSQDVKPSEAKVIVTQPLAILDLGLQHRRVLDGLAASGPCFGACNGRTGSFPLPEFSVWRDTAGTRETGGPGTV